MTDGSGSDLSLVSQRMIGKQVAIRVGMLPYIGSGHLGMLPGLQISVTYFLHQR